VNSLVWALLFEGIFGPVRSAACWRSRSAPSASSASCSAKRWRRRRRARRSIARGRAPWLSVLGYGYWPQVKPAFWSIALFRFDINVRESAVLGLVGAGGIGMALDAALNLFQWDRVALILVAILAVVIVTEIAVTFVRQRVL
jgi:phosphonate transport system permease protein